MQEQRPGLHHSVFFSSPHFLFSVCAYDTEIEKRQETLSQWLCRTYKIMRSKCGMESAIRFWKAETINLSYKLW